MFNTFTRPAVSASFRRVQVLIRAVRQIQSPRDSNDAGRVEVV